MKAVGKRNDEVEQRESSILMEMEQSRGNIENEEKRHSVIITSQHKLGNERKLVRDTFLSLPEVTGSTARLLL